MFDGRRKNYYCKQKIEKCLQEFKKFFNIINCIIWPKSDFEVAISKVHYYSRVHISFNLWNQHFHLHIKLFCLRPCLCALTAFIWCIPSILYMYICYIVYIIPTYMQNIIKIHAMLQCGDNNTIISCSTICLLFPHCDCCCMASTGGDVGHSLYIILHMWMCAVCTHQPHIEGVCVWSF